MTSDADGAVKMLFTFVWLRGLAPSSYEAVVYQSRNPILACRDCRGTLWCCRIFDLCRSTGRLHSCLYCSVSRSKENEAVVLPDIG